MLCERAVKLTTTSCGGVDAAEMWFLSLTTRLTAPMSRDKIKRLHRLWSDLHHHDPKSRQETEEHISTEHQECEVARRNTWKKTREIKGKISGKSAVQACFAFSHS